MLEHLHSYMPGFSRCFTDVFDSEILLWVAKSLGTAAQIVGAGIDGLAQQLRDAHISTHKPTLQKVVASARIAPAVEESASLHRRLFIELEADRLAKLRSIRSIESELAGPLSKTPYVLLLGIPGINVVSAAEFAGEMRARSAPASKARAITKRARTVPVTVSKRRGRPPRWPAWCGTPTATCGERLSSLPRL